MGCGSQAVSRVVMTASRQVRKRKALTAPHKANHPIALMPNSVDSCMLQITPMTLADIPAILEIEQSSHVQAWNKGFFEEELSRPQSHTYVARLTGVDEQTRIVGYICFWIVADEIQILNIAVHLAHRRRGVGKALLLHALEVGYAHKARVALLEVRRGNEAAQRLYQTLGFKPTGERKGYYGGLRDPAVLMELEMDRKWRSLWYSAVEAPPLAERARS